jgi:hypothetical protein
MKKVRENSNGKQKCRKKSNDEKSNGEKSTGKKYVISGLVTDVISGHVTSGCSSSLFKW